MAQLVLGVAGAVVGGYFGGPSGAQLGFALGSFVGGVVDPPDPAQVVGPRIGDVNITQSTYGAPIPLVFGTVRMGANLIWVGEAQEVAVQTESGGKGGAPSAVTTTFKTFIDFAVGFGEGPADEILRIWFNKQLVYDARAPNPAAGTRFAKLLGPGISFKFYRGTEDQLPDPTIEAKQGVGMTPANRGLVYMVVTGHDLSSTNNALPQIEAEIAYSAVDNTGDRFSDDFTTGEGGLFSTWQTDEFTVDHRRRRIYAVGGGAAAGIRVFDMDTLLEVRQISDADITTDKLGMGQGLHAGTSGFLYTNAGPLNSKPVIKIDSDSLKEVARFGFSSNQVVLPSTGSVLHWPAVNQIVELPMICPLQAQTNAHFHFIVGHGVVGTGRLFVARSRTLGLQGVADHVVTPGLSGLDTVIGIAADEARVNLASGWFCTQASANSEIKVYRIEIIPAASYLLDAFNNRSSVGTDVELIGTIPASTWESNGGGVSFTVDRSDSSLIFVMDRASPVGAYVFKWSQALGVVWTSQVNTAGVGNLSYTPGSFLRGSTIGWANTSEEAALLSTHDGEVLVDNVDWAAISGGTPVVVGDQFYDSNSQSVYALQGSGSVVGQLFLNRASGLGTTDGAIVTAISERVGFDAASQLNVTELTHPLTGFIVGRKMTARAALEQLGTAFFWDGVESDGKVVYKNRGRAPIRTIDDSEMLETGNALSAVVEERIQEVELPEVVSVTFLDADRDHQPNTKSFKRIKVPDPTMRSVSHIGIQLAIVMTADQAAQIAEKLCFTLWNERVKYSWKTAWDHLDLDPADVVNVTLNGTAVTNLRTRIAANNVGANLAIEFTGFREDAETFLSDSTTSDETLFPVQVVPGAVDTRLFLLDIPFIRDRDDIGRSASVTHMAMNGYSIPWPGGVLFSSPDATVFTNTGLKNVTGVVFGTMLEPVASVDDPMLTDNVTQLRVLLHDGTLSTASDADFLAGANAAAIGIPGTGNFEIIRFQTAVQQADTSWTLTTLKRGRRGTDWYVDDHVAGEKFFLLDANTLTKLIIDTSELNVASFYKGVGFGQIPEDAEVVSFASTMADLKPWAPGHVAAVVDGSSNIDISWIRRTRVGGKLKNEVTGTPLGEDTESYEIDIRQADKLWRDTVLLVDFDGADGATTALDASRSGHTLTFVNQAQIDTAQSKFGGSSLLVDGADDYVSVPSSFDFEFLAGQEFTMEFHVRFSTLTGEQSPMAVWRVSGELGFTFRKDTGNEMLFSWTENGTTGGGTLTTTSWGPSINTWYHVVAERNKDGLVRLYVDGVVRDSVTYTGDFYFSSDPITIGSETTAREVNNGHVDEVRITRKARYDGAFTPPTLPHPDQTVLRTLVATTNLVEYASGDITTDFGGTPAAIDIDVIQMSAQVGRGFSNQVIIDL